MALPDKTPTSWEQQSLLPAAAVRIRYTVVLQSDQRRISYGYEIEDVDSGVTVEMAARPLVTLGDEGLELLEAGVELSELLAKYHVPF